MQYCFSRRHSLTFARRFVRADIGDDYREIPLKFLDHSRLKIFKHARSTCDKQHNTIVVVEKKYSSKKPRLRSCGHEKASADRHAPASGDFSGVVNGHKTVVYFLFFFLLSNRSNG